MSRHNSTQQNNVKGTSGDYPPKPKRPLTIYNIFSALERNFIIQQHQPSSDCPNESNEINPYLATRPERYRDVVLPPNWYKVGMNKTKRSNYKCHGIISFKELSKAISERWAAVDTETRQYVQMISDHEMEQYRQDLIAYEAKYGREALDAQKTTYKKRPKKNDAAATAASKPKRKREEYDSDVSEDESDYSSISGCGETSNQAKSESGFAAGMDQTHYQKVAAQQLSRKAKAKKRDGSSGKNAGSSNSDSGSRLSDYLPDDKEEALKLVDNDSDNILYGEELEKAFDSDE